MTALRFFAAALPLVAALAAPVRAQELVERPYETMAALLDARITFEAAPRRPEPGIAFDAPLREGRAWLGERFAGMAPAVVRDRHGARFDGASGRPLAPLAVLPGPPGRNLSIAFHRGLGSNALFPLGPDGFPALSGRGEGALAVLFDDDQPGFALVIHTDYPDPLGADSRPRGALELRFFDRAGQPLGTHRHRPPRGRSTLGLARPAGRRDIAGVLILNTDPGGIALDDLLYASPLPTG